MTSMDFLDHILTRLSESNNFNNQHLHQGIIDKVNFTKQIEELKIKMEQVLVLAVTDYFFSYLNPSLLAASAAHLVLSRLTNETKITEDLCQYIGAITVRFLFVYFVFMFIKHIYKNILCCYRVTSKIMFLNWKKSFQITYYAFRK